MLFRSRDLDLHLDPMTLIYELDPYILKTYLHTKNELSRSKLLKVRVLQTDRQTDKQTRPETLLPRIGD